MKSLWKEKEKKNIAHFTGPTLHVTLCKWRLVLTYIWVEKQLNRDSANKCCCAENDVSQFEDLKTPHRADAGEREGPEDSEEPIHVPRTPQ